jgi:CubicO group peptidase (beta-lactamase class C family)
VHDALPSVADWPVTTAAAGVLDPAGVVHVHGDGNRRLPLASVTKLLTAAAVLGAAEEGSVDLDEPAPAPPGATVRDLLCHASGIAPDSDAVVSAPRRRRVYSTRGYEVLGDLVAARTGFTFADYLREAVLEPLGMRSTTLEGSPGADAVSTVADLLAFAAGLRRAGVLSAPSLQAFATVQHPALEGVLPGFGVQRPNPWGLGPEIRGEKAPHWTGTRNSPATFGHFGRCGTFLWIDPVPNVALVALTDRVFGDWARTAWPAFSDAVLDGWVV